jgi:nucleoside phosphorylase
MPVARKAACLLDVLRREKLVSHKTIVSDRVLDMDTQWLSGLSVLLVDDILVSGSTISEIIKCLQEAGAAVTTTILVADIDWWNAELVQPVEGYLRYGHNKAIESSRALVDFLNLTPRPYNVDWPLFETTLPKQTAKKIFNLPQYLGYDVATSAQRTEDIHAYTFEPAPFVQAQLGASVGVSLAAVTSIVKIRLLVDMRRQRARVTMFPIVIFSGIRLTQVESLFRELAHSSVDEQILLRSFTTPQSQIRALQWVISYRLGLEFQGHCRYADDAIGAWFNDPRQAEYIFIPDTVYLLKEIANNSAPIFSSALPSDELADEPLIHLPLKPSGKPDQANLLQAQLTQPFVGLHRRLELKARNLLKERGKTALGDPETAQITNRLKSGFTVSSLNDLARRSQPGMTEEDIGLNVSIFLDLAVDSGIAVPIIEINGDHVFRSYRHGEDVLFGETEMQLCWHMLSAFARSWRRDEIPQVALEKMIVLLLRIGLQQNIFTPWDGALGQSGSMGIRHRLHGAVVYTNAASLFNSFEGQPLTDILRSYSVISKRKGMYRLGDPRPGVPVARGTRANVELVGSLFGTLLRPAEDTARPVLTAEDLTLLASCLKFPDLLKALAAEVFIAKEELGSITDAFRRFVEGRPYVELNRQVLGSKFYTAINSGSLKYRRYSSGYPDLINDKVSEQLADPVYASTWQSFYSSLTERGTVTSDKGARELVRGLANWIFYANLFVRMGIVGALDINTSGKFARRESYRAKYVAQMEEIASYFSLTAAPGDSVQRWVDSQVSDVLSGKIRGAALAERAMRGFNTLAMRADQLLDEANARAGPDGRIRSTFQFKSALVLQIGSSQADQQRIADLFLLMLDVVSRSNRYTSAVKLLPQHLTNDRVVVVSASADPEADYLTIVEDVIRKASYDVRLNILMVTSGVYDTCLYNGTVSSEWYGSAFIQGLLDCQMPDITGSSAHGIRIHAGSRAAIDIIDAWQPTTISVLPQGDATNIRLGEERGIMAKDYKLEVTKPLADVGIVTVLMPEARAVIERLSRHGSMQERWDQASLRAFYSGRIQEGTSEISVVMTQCVDPKATSATAACHALIREASPRVLILLGIGGGISDDVALGDVVIANQVVAYDNRKESSEGIAYRGEAWKLSVAAKNMLHSFFANESPDRNGSYSLHTGPVGTGGAVLGYKKSKTRKWLLHYNSKLMAVETEAEGVEQYFYESEDLQRLKTVLVIRGISDKADEEKDDKWHGIASANAIDAVARMTPWIKRLLT